ncbi:MAG: M91 family zinc metallopeptidase [Xanthomarina gelatinilytica]|uniref:M91 family zinc metallopeptidase n=1 Tax=Xanthomarina gelatinilytica TaxID=1137281 RepID=UPI003A846EF5
MQYEYRYDFKNKVGKYYDPKTGKEIKGIAHSSFNTIKGALDKISSKEYGSTFINTLERSLVDYNIIINNEGINGTIHGSQRVKVDPDKKVETFLTNGIKESPFHITLAHELGHAYGNYTGEADSTKWYNFGGKQVNKSELFASSIENVIRKEQGLGIRKYYSHYINTKEPYRRSLLLPRHILIFMAPVFFNQNTSFGSGQNNPARIKSPRYLNMKKEIIILLLLSLSYLQSCNNLMISITYM